MTFVNPFLFLGETTGLANIALTVAFGQRTVVQVALMQPAHVLGDILEGRVLVDLLTCRNIINTVIVRKSEKVHFDNLHFTWIDTALGQFLGVGDPLYYPALMVLGSH